MLQRVSFTSPLVEGDTENQTVGCRQNNPKICKYNGIDSLCAFASSDGICKKPSRSWKKQYEKLKEMKEEES